MVINDINDIKGTDSPRRFIVSGGGTGGHIYPAMSIADAIKKRHPEASILFVGAIGRMEMEKVPRGGYDIIGLPVRGLDRKRLWRNVGVMIDYWKAQRTCRKIVKRVRPDAVIGVGGYASAPMLKAAQKAGVVTVLQEQNSYAGVTNKMLAKGAKYISVAYKGMERFFPADVIELTGNPIREEIANVASSREEAKEQLGFDPAKPLLLVVGGSLGARTINRAMQGSIDRLQALGISILWQTGKNWEQPAAGSLPEGCRSTAFIDNMALAYRAADLVVARAGACTVSEIQLLGKPAILIPSPNVAEDHQRHNAEALVKEQAAVMILDSEAERTLYDEVSRIIGDPELLDRLGRNARSMAVTGSAERIARKIDELTDS